MKAAWFGLAVAVSEPAVVHRKFDSETLLANEPRLHKDLSQYTTQCFRTAIQATTALIEVSVVGLTGNPTVVGGWEPQDVPIDTKHHGGFAVWQTPAVLENNGAPPQPVVVPDGTHDYFTCVTTYSEQGCDFLITVFVDGDSAKPDTMIPVDMPSIWQLGASPRKFRLTEAHGKNAKLKLDLLVTPLEGEAQLAVINCDTGKEVGSSALEGPDWVSIPSQAEDVCILISGTFGAFVAVEASQGMRTLAQSIPLALMIQKNTKCSVPFQVFVNPNTDIGFTVTENVDVYAGWKEADEHRYDWKGTDGLLNIKKDHFKMLRTTGTIYAAVCKKNATDTDSFVLCTSSSGSSTMTIGEGETLTIKTERENSRAAGKWTDFRFFIPVSHTFSTLTLKATATTSAVKIMMVADTTHYAHNPKAYRWEVPKPYASDATMVFTRDPSLHNDRVHLIDCRPPCYVYATVYAYDTANLTAPTAYNIALSSENSVSQLVDELGSEQTLGPLKSQDFYYRLPSKTDPILVGVSCPSGQVQFMVSNTPTFDSGPKHTTTFGKEVVLLDSALQIVQQAKDVLYIRVHNAEETPASFIITCRIERELQKMENGGTPINGAIRPHEYNHYVVDIPGGPELPDQRVHVDLEALAGDPNVYVSLTDKHVDKRSAMWSSETAGSDELDINSTDARWTGKVYIGVSALEESAYSLVVSWGNNTVVTLIDGVRSRGDAHRHAARLYFLAAAGDMRLSPIRGSVAVCPKEPNAAEVQAGLCQNVTTNQVAAFSTKGSQYFEVTSIDGYSTYDIWSSISAPLTFHEGEICRDKLETSFNHPHRSRIFQVFVIPLVTKIRVTVSPESHVEHVRLSARRNGEERWVFDGKPDGSHVVLELNRSESQRLANRWLEILVDVTAVVEYTITVDYGQMQLEPQEVLTDAPAIPVNSSVETSRLFTLTNPNATLHIRQCLNRVRTYTGSSSKSLSKSLSVTNRTSTYYNLTSEDRFALITPELAGAYPGLDRGIYEVSVHASDFAEPRRFSGLSVVSNVVSIPVPRNVTQMHAFFVRKEYMGIFHISSLCGLRAMESLAAAEHGGMEGMSVQRIPLDHIHNNAVSIFSPWTHGNWAVNVKVVYRKEGDNGTERAADIFAPAGNFNLMRLEEGHGDDLTRQKSIIPLILFLLTAYCGLGFLYNVKMNGQSGLSALPHANQFSARTFNNSHLEVPLQSIDDPYRPLVEDERYEPPRIPV